MCNTIYDVLLINYFRDNRIIIELIANLHTLLTFDRLTA